jgi:hypothetical protein
VIIVIVGIIIVTPTTVTSVKCRAAAAVGADAVRCQSISQCRNSAHHMKELLQITPAVELERDRELSFEAK